MKIALKQINHKIESFFYRIGFKSEILRKIATKTILIDIILLFVALVTYPMSKLFFWIFLGSFLASIEFILLAYSVQKTFLHSPNKTFIFIQLMFAQLRLFLNAFIIYKLVTMFNASLIACLAGISIIPFIIVFTIFYERFITRFREA